MNNAISPTDYSVISQALMSSAREMGVKLCRSAYSPIIREAKDASTGILNARGESVAQSDELIPVLVGSLSLAFAGCAAADPIAELSEGDFYVNNHPYSGGHHLNDICIFLPIFWNGQLIGFSASVAHHIDLGGNMGVMATDLFQEGLILSPGKYSLERDWNGKGLQRLITANVRLPSQTIGDFNSQFASCRVGVQRVQELCAKYGPERVRAAMDGMLDYSERRVRAAIQAVPDGTYSAEAVIDPDSVTEHPLTVRAKLTIAGSSAEIDFSGTATQAKSNLNAPLASTVAATMTVIKAVLTGNEDVPFNEGVFRPVRIHTPEGSLLNPKFPAPVQARMEAAYRAFDAVLMCFGQAIPERVNACGFNSTYSTALSVLDDDGYRIFLEVHGGGWGASARGDGCDAVAQPLSNCTNVPVETIDMGYDYFRIESYSIIPDSGGRGRYRGGHGTRRTFRVLKDGVRFRITGDRFDKPASGLAGGEDGARASCEVHRGDERITFGPLSSAVLRKGDLLVVSTGGGGGYGHVGAPDTAGAIG